MSKKLLIILIILIITLFLFLSCVGSSAQNEIKAGDKLWITCPKNLAVFHILVFLSPSGERMKGRFLHPLAKEAKDYFHSFKNHPAVMKTDGLFRMMWYFALNYLAFYYSDFPEAQLVSKIPPEYEEWKSMEKMISEYVLSVRDFYISSKFEDFWQAHTKDIQALMKEVKSNLPSFSLPQLLEDFYGRSAVRFYYVPCPFMASSATHVEIQNKDKGWVFYYIDGLQSYKDKFASAYYAFHEFSHSFIEPISKEYSRELNRLSYLYQPLKADFQRMGYSNWDRAFAEHIVTAGQLHLTRKVFGLQKAKEMLEKEQKKGFKLIGNFYDYLWEYDKNRQRYKDLSSFYPVLLSRLSRIKVEEYRRPDILGFYHEFQGEKCFIKDVIPNLAFQKVGFEKGDVLHSIGKIKIKSERDLARAMKNKNSAKPGDSLKVVVIRNGQKIEKLILIPFISDYKYVEDK